MRVRMKVNGKTVRRRVHVVILITFRGPRPLGYEGCHGDGDKKNNALANLRWDSPEANRRDRFEKAAHRRLHIFLLTTSKRALGNGS
ncbi:MAG: hypothetical protein QOF78_281 [Phycisphaerales bacterium]|jgi:hypothetical protein|nr:hypothetical protein [Phycisphaerales bacterium]